ncbi:MULTISPECIES: restriction endonuclease subunit S [Corynebacterium]|uniref:restriction endonuclease subunit S n=1 Tax=Corynebacterium TaxID=1716 RepID=UPI0019084AFE|nr:MULTISPECIES: restriction endonuclease subunit S [Corynebacterium]MDU4570621.1 restriction endonuclease subunit S [Corynebacterium sp.]MDU6012333.1 restriction endonuclease subunit S [Corynebacterium sp.]QQN48060.1 restriction endonuclease subunit S [Corynebacterium kefirresidentii]
MQTIQIADGCSQITSGATPSRKKPEYFIGDIPWLKTKELNDALIGATEEHISESALAETSCKLIPSGAVVIAMYGATVGKLGILGTPMTTNQACCAMVADEVSLHSQYLFYWLLQNRQSIINLSNGAAQQNLSVRTIKNIALKIPTLEKQIHTANALKSLDDKINANNRIVDCTLELQRAHWLKALVGVPSIDLSEITSPVLGGTPKRSDEALWEGTNLWASVADMTKAPHSHLVDTAEKISDDAIQTRRFSPLPTGAILMSARGTVGRIVSTTKPTSFNQSAYGFVPPEGYGPALRLALSDVVAELKSKSYGSVFSTITKQQINECTVPDVFNPQFDELHTLLNTLESRIIAAELENQVLARTRDELLPLLMSGRITVGEAEEAADVAGSAASES